MVWQRRSHVKDDVCCRYQFRLWDGTLFISWIGHRRPALCPCRVVVRSQDLNKSRWDKFWSNVLSEDDIPSYLPFTSSGRSRAGSNVWPDHLKWRHWLVLPSKKGQNLMFCSEHCLLKERPLSIAFTAGQHANRTLQWEGVCMKVTSMVQRSTLANVYVKDSSYFQVNDQSTLRLVRQIALEICLLQ